MGMDMASVDAPFGLQPWGEVLRQRLYAVLTAPTINVYHGDLVLHGGSSVGTSYGTLPYIEDGAVPGGVSNEGKQLGAVLSIFDENMDPVSYIAAGETGDSTIAGYVMVADHPDQQFIIQEDGDTNAIDLSEVGFNCDIVDETLCAGDSNTGLSKSQLDSTSAAATAALDVKLYGPHPDDTVATDTTPYTRWIVQLNTHFYAQFNAGL